MESENTQEDQTTEEMTFVDHRPLPGMRSKATEQEPRIGGTNRQSFLNSPAFFPPPEGTMSQEEEMPAPEGTTLKAMEEEETGARRRKSSQWREPYNRLYFQHTALREEHLKLQAKLLDLYELLAEAGICIPELRQQLGP